ncbi:MAG: hypothetical protein EOP60_08585 [Sphingomonadales bacterium]|nr:MAG: hypothetical protein EOP60_08585 [Sphingomonadales bacterium]
MRLRGLPAPVVTIAQYENRTEAPFDVAPAEPFPLEPITLTSPYAATSLRTLKAWRLTGRLAQITTSANGLYAVRDGLADYRKPRAFRPSALGAMLVLRIDGKDESPPFSVGGGGVAAALWRAMPR